MNHIDSNLTSYSDFGSSTANSLGTGSIGIAGIIAFFLVGLLAFAVWRDVAWVRRLRKLVMGLGTISLYALMGVGALTPFAVVGTLTWLFIRLPGGTQVNVAKWFGIAIAAYLALAGIGWIAERWFNRVKANLEAARTNETQEPTP